MTCKLPTITATTTNNNINDDGDGDGDLRTLVELGVGAVALLLTGLLGMKPNQLPTAVAAAW